MGTDGHGPLSAAGTDRNGVSAGAGGTAVVIIVIVIRGHCAGDIVDLHRVIFLKGGGAVIPGERAIAALHKAEVLHEVPQDGHITGIAVVGTQQAQSPLDQRYIHTVDSLRPAVHIRMTAVSAEVLVCIFGRELLIDPIGLQHILSPVLQRGGFKALGHIPQVHLTCNEHGRNGLKGRIFFFCSCR